ESAESRPVRAPNLNLVLLTDVPEPPDEGPLGGAPALLLHEVEDPSPDQLLGLIPQQLGRSVVDEDRAPVPVEQPDALVGRVDDLSVSLVGAAGGALDAVAADG